MGGRHSFTLAKNSLSYLSPSQSIQGLERNSLFLAMLSLFTHLPLSQLLASLQRCNTTRRPKKAARTYQLKAGPKERETSIRISVIERMGEDGEN